MDRYVHHELRSVFSALAVVAVCAPLTVLAHGAPVSAVGLPMFTLGLIAFATVCTLLQSTRIKWLGEVRDFEAAVPLEESPVEKPLRRRPVNPWLFTMMTAAALGFAFALDPAASLFPALACAGLARPGLSGRQLGAPARQGAVAGPRPGQALTPARHPPTTDSNRHRCTARVTNPPSGSGSSGSTAS